MADEDVSIPLAIDWEPPAYSDVLADRMERLIKLKSDPQALAAAKVYYATHPWDFIADWGMTFDPRLVNKEQAAVVPFLLWPKQKEYVEWMYKMWQKGERGLVEKSRDAGVTWLSVGFAVSMFLFVDGFTAGFGSRKEELVDKKGDDKSIFEKVRFFLRHVPEVFMPVGYLDRTCSAYMRIRNPERNGAIIGESGDEIGRGGRTSIYMVDEAAFIQRQETVDAALSQNTDCQLDISTPNGNGNLFYKKQLKFHNTHRKFIFDWRDDPRKDQAWYDKQEEEQDEVTVAQEINRDYNASQEDVFIPAKYVQAAIDAHEKLGFMPEGVKVAGFDVADTGDAKGLVLRHGSVVTDCAQLTKGDINQAIPWAFRVAEKVRADCLAYDGDGMGDPVMKVYQENRPPTRLRVISYRGSGGVRDPKMPVKRRKKVRSELTSGVSSLSEHEPKTNADSYYNFRAQSWSDLRTRFANTYHAIEAAKAGGVIRYDDDDLISLNGKSTDIQQLVAELSRPKRIFSNNGKILVESKKEMKTRGVDSPNLADALVIAYSVTGDILIEHDDPPPPRFDRYEPVMDGVI